MIIRPAERRDRDAWLEMRLALWPDGTADEHRGEIDDTPAIHWVLGAPELREAIEERLAEEFPGLGVAVHAAAEIRYQDFDRGLRGG